MCHYDYYLYKEMGRTMSKKELDYAVEMCMTDNIFVKLWIWVKYKFKKSY